MGRNFFLPSLFVLATTLIGTVVDAQTPPIILDHFKLLPQASVLHESGGIAGVNRLYRLTGKYDLAHGVGWVADASFENAEIWGSQVAPFPTPAVVIDVDKILNLEGLKGESLPVASPFPVYQFTGNAADGSSERLVAAVIGPWMYMRGGTTPPEGSADFFKYEISAVARSPRPFADLNGDGTVDAADFVLLRNYAGAASADVASFNDWIQQFGEKFPDFSGYDAMMASALGSLSAGATVPEPSAHVLLLIAGTVFALRRR